MIAEPVLEMVSAHNARLRQRASSSQFVFSLGMDCANGKKGVEVRTTQSDQRTRGDKRKAHLNDLTLGHCSTGRR